MQEHTHPRGDSKPSTCNGRMCSSFYVVSLGSAEMQAPAQRPRRASEPSVHANGKVRNVDASMRTGSLASDADTVASSPVGDATDGRASWPSSRGSSASSPPRAGPCRSAPNLFSRGVAPAPVSLQRISSAGTGPVPSTMPLSKPTSRTPSAALKKSYSSGSLFYAKVIEDALRRAHKKNPLVHSPK